MVRAPVSKTGGWGFESLLSCHLKQRVVKKAKIPLGFSHRFRTLPPSETGEKIDGARPPAQRERDSSARTRDPEEGCGFFRQGGKSMRFSFIDAKRAEFPVARLRGSRGQPERLFCLEKLPRKRTPMQGHGASCHIRERFRLSQETCGARACMPISLRMVSSRTPQDCQADAR